MRHILAKFFAAEPRARKNFCWIGELHWIKSAAYALHGIEVWFREHFGLDHFFIFADAVFTVDRAARGDAEFHNSIRQCFDSMFLPGDSLVVEHKRMEVSIAGMKHIRYAQTCFFAQALDFAHDPRQRGSRDHAILDDVVG